jgi:hypothetical protein
MAPQTAFILFAGWFIGALGLAFLPRERSIRWKLIAIALLLTSQPGNTRPESPLRLKKERR